MVTYQLELKIDASVSSGVNAVIVLNTNNCAILAIAVVCTG